MIDALSRSLDDLYRVSHLSLEPQNAFGRGAHWLHESPFLPVGWETTNASGAASLKQTAMRVLMRDQSLLNLEIFKTVPWVLAMYIWESMYRCKKRTLWLWKIFTTIYPRFRDNAPSYALTAYRPKNPLAQYFDLLNGDNCAWGATLVVAPGITDAQNLVSIANIKNLLGLEISTYQRSRGYLEDPDEHKGDLEDKVVRSWMDMALQDGCLQHLRIVRFAHQHRVTPNILWMLAKLPALELIVMHDCPIIVPDGPKPRSRGSKHRRDGQTTSGLRMHGWMGRCRSETTMEYDEADSLRPLGSLAEICRPKGLGECVDFPPTSNNLGHLQRSTSRGLELPLLSFELRETEHYSACFTVGTRSTFVFHRDHQPSAKGTDDGEDAPGHRQKRSKGGGRDLSDLLGEFMG